MEFNLETISSFVSLFGTACGLVSIFLKYIKFMSKCE